MKKLVTLLVCTICTMLLLEPNHAQAQIGLTYHPVTPCRVLDTRDPLIGHLQADMPHNLPLATTPPICGLPPNLQGTIAYSINITVIPRGPKVSFLTAWATGTLMPPTSIINDPLGVVIANHAIVQVLTSQSNSISFLATDDTDLVVDIDGYFN